SAELITSSWKIGVPALAGISTELRTMLALPESAEMTPMVSCAKA
ncbi:MAG: hypothetical protein HOJ43_08370, partial [Betaproteobacteria bacterium]|nr:hypothetical protein [Betaproteobacteria bacterium]